VAVLVLLLVPQIQAVAVVALVLVKAQAVLQVVQELSLLGMRRKGDINGWNNY
jgi:hypothetical protein